MHKLYVIKVPNLPSYSTRLQSLHLDEEEYICKSRANEKNSVTSYSLNSSTIGTIYADDCLALREAPSQPVHALK